MTDKIGAAALLALGLALASSAALADDQRNDCVAAGGETVNGMPATKHQEEVLGKKPDDQPSQGQQQACATDNGMPASPHQENTLDKDKAKPQG
jgi:hypothetical protein